MPFFITPIIDNLQVRSVPMALGDVWVILDSEILRFYDGEDILNDLNSAVAVLMSRIREAERLSGRPRGSVGLVAVTKGQSADTLRQAYDCGIRDFGENYVSEALDKMAALKDLPDLVWHFIGPIQSNKARQIAETFSWVHSVDRFKVAGRLNEFRPENLPPLEVCIQVNVSGEASKSGVAVDQLAELADEIRWLHRLRLRGLMAIPAPSKGGNSDPRDAFRALREMMERLPTGLDTLSMGMSDDFETAISEGATKVRVGTLLFGSRQR